MKKKNIIIISCVFILAICLALLVDPLFWIIIPLFPASIFMYLAVLFSKSKWVGIIISLACGLVFFSIAEAGLYLFLPKAHKVVGGESKYISEGVTTHVVGDNLIKDPILGHASKHMKVQTASMRMDRDRVTYDVLYSWDEKGRRITPDNTATADNLVILLGCSFTFGDGLEDKETFAWQLSELLGSDFQVLNYGYSGYGSHQMLALLESDRLDYLKTKYKNIYAFHVTFPGVEQRSAGMAHWDQNGPKYVLNDDGTVSYSGQLNTTFSSSIFGQSAFLKVLQKVYAKYLRRDFTLDLHAAIMLKAAAVFNNKFENDLVIITYPDYKQLKERLEKNNMEIIDMDMYFDDYTSNKEKYTIKSDGHPNVEATKIIAKTIYEYLEKKPQ